MLVERFSFHSYQIIEPVQIIFAKRTAYGQLWLGSQWWSTLAKVSRISWNRIGPSMAETTSHATTMKNANSSRAMKWWILLKKPSPIHRSLEKCIRLAAKAIKQKSQTISATSIRWINQFQPSKWVHFGKHLFCLENSEKKQLESIRVTVLLTTATSTKNYDRMNMT